MHSNAVVRWLLRWRRSQRESSNLPYNLSTQELDALKSLRASPQWPHYLAVVERLGEQQATELTSGLSHDRYLFACGALHALRRVYTAVDDLLAAAQQLKELNDARSRNDARRDARRANAFLNTPWWNGAGFKPDD